MKELEFFVRGILRTVAVIMIACLVHLLGGNGYVPPYVLIIAFLFSVFAFGL